MAEFAVNLVLLSRGLGQKDNRLEPGFYSRLLSMAQIPDTKFKFIFPPRFPYVATRPCLEVILVRRVWDISMKSGFLLRCPSHA